MAHDQMSRNAPDFGAYQRIVATLWASSHLGRGVTYPGHEAAVKLAEETGEVAKEVGLLGHAYVTPGQQASRERLLTEIGDCLFVLTRIANIYGLSMGRAAQVSVEKFATRYAGPIADTNKQALPRSCPGDLSKCVFMNDDVVPVGSTCAACGAVKAPEGAGDARQRGSAEPSGEGTP